MNNVEEPCAVDGEACSWVVEEDYTTNGKLIRETYCDKCFRYRDYHKSEYEKKYTT